MRKRSPAAITAAVTGTHGWHSSASLPTMAAHMPASLSAPRASGSTMTPMSVNGAKIAAGHGQVSKAWISRAVIRTVLRRGLDATLARALHSTYHLVGRKRTHGNHRAQVRAGHSKTRIHPGTRGSAAQHLSDGMARRDTEARRNLRTLEARRVESLGVQLGRARSS